MNIQEYISSGIAESYVLGLASEEERREFEKMCEQYPELLEARMAFEISLEKMAMDNAIVPPAALKNLIMEQLDFSAPVIPIQSATIRPMQAKSSSNWLKYAAAACLLLLAGSVYWNITLTNKNKNLESNYNNTTAELNDLKKDLQVLQSNPNVKMAAMGGKEASPQSFATVYWDTTSHDVYLMLNNLPKPASDKQYQLWAFLDGKPIDMGLIEITEKPLQLYRLKKAQSAQAFAITLEEKGRPDITKPRGEVYVLGNL